MTLPVEVSAVTACTRQAAAAGSGNEPRSVLVRGSPLVIATSLSQPALRTPSEPQAPPPVLGRPSVSMARTRAVSPAR